MVLATLQFMRRTASSVDVQQVSERELHQELAHCGFTTLPPGVLVDAVEGPLFFGAVENAERALTSAHTDPRVLVIRLRWVPFINITALKTLEEVIPAQAMLRASREFFAPNMVKQTEGDHR